MTVDLINHPPHYTSSPARCTCGRPIECIDVTRHMGFNLGNAVKYLWRADLKGAALDDLRKAVWYLQDEIAKREAANRLPDEGISFDVVKAERDAARQAAGRAMLEAEWCKWTGQYDDDADHIARRQAGLDAIIREAEAAGLYDVGKPQSPGENAILSQGEWQAVMATHRAAIVRRPCTCTVGGFCMCPAAPRSAPENGLPASDLGGVAAKDQTAFWAQNNGGEA